MLARPLESRKEELPWRHRACESCARAPCKVPEQGRVQYGVKVVWTGWRVCMCRFFTVQLTILLIEDGLKRRNF